MEALSSYPAMPLRATTDNSDAEVEDNIYIFNPKSLRIQVISWVNVYHVWVSAFFVRFLYPVAVCGCAVAVGRRIQAAPEQYVAVWNAMLTLPSRSWETVQVAVLCVALLSCVAAVVQRWKTTVYCVDHVEFVPPESWKVSHEDIIKIWQASGQYNAESLTFMKRVLEASATGQETHWPPGATRCLQGLPPLTSMAAARSEVEDVVLPCFANLLEKCKLKPGEIDYLIVNCSLFSPTPSICAMIANKFKLRADVCTYNLGGMGCSANVISVDLARQLLQANPGKVCVVVSNENLTQNMYYGNDRPFLLQNTLFRIGCTAIMMSNRPADAMRAKYKLLHTVRTQTSDDEAYQAVFQCGDSEGQPGVRLSKDIVKVAGRALQRNFTAMGPYVLPMREQLKTGLSLALRAGAQLLKRQLKSFGLLDLADLVFAVDPYIPDFCRGVDHWCIHAGGRAVIDGIQKNLRLSDWHTLPSRETLRQYGNTSSSSIWYELRWIEEHGKLLAGQRVFQVAFGSGFKCNSAVWLCLRTEPTPGPHVFKRVDSTASVVRTPA
mmetsp:Transcript_52617/g.112694  ORF Transcript_52617/g.112694 Transcript_52617/m.112694 type:complete len:550 (-) Transcript_52617:53-1702(-)